MKLYKTTSMASVLVACLGSGAAYGATKTCVTGGCSVPTGVDCATYQQVLINPPNVVNTTPHSHTLLNTSSQSNCGPQRTYAGTFGVQYSISEGITHSCSGSLTSTVGASVGTAGVAAASLQFATTAGNGWQKVDTYSSGLSWSWNYNVPQCKIDRVAVYGDWVDSVVSGSGYLHSNYFNDDTGNWESTDCSTTTSNASASNKVYKNVSGETLPELDCPSGCVPI